MRAWAEPVYAAALALDPWLSTAGCSLATLVLRRGWETAKRTYPEVREFLQRVGVEAGRNIHGPECWVKLTDLTGPVSIVGTRFVNEIQAVWRAKGSVVWVTRPGIEAANDHASEHQLGPQCADYVLRNDGTLEDLAVSVQTMLEVLGLDPGPAGPGVSYDDKLTRTLDDLTAALDRADKLESAIRMALDMGWCHESRELLWGAVNSDPVNSDPVNSDPERTAALQSPSRLLDDPA